MVLAKRAFIAGKTVFTPTSHGSSNFPPITIILGGNVYKDDACHSFMTHVMTGYLSK
jgi:hypothetical protein